MSLAQQLVLRALVAWFWEQPYRRPLIRFGTALHDRFMLPHFVWRDFETVCADLRRQGLPVRAEWFATHFEFRFPLLRPRHPPRRHARAARGARALARAGRGGRGRRHRPLRRQLARAAAGQGRRAWKAPASPSPATAAPCPCSRPARRGEQVAGVRFRAWQPPNCLHPTIGRPRAAHASTWSTAGTAARWAAAPTTSSTRPAATTRSCRSTSSRPRAAGWPGSRRAATRRGRSSWAQPDVHPEFPHTLDLRRFGQDRAAAASRADVLGGQDHGPTLS